MSRTVHQPRHVKCDAVAELSGKEPCCAEAFSPEEPRHKCWDEETRRQYQWNVIPMDKIQ